MAHQARRLAREIAKHSLRDLLGQMRTATGAPERGRIDQIKTLPHKVGKRTLVVVFDIAAEQLGIGGHASSDNRSPPKNPQEIPTESVWAVSAPNVFGDCPARCLSPPRAQSRKGNCYGSAHIESFWSSLKFVVVYHRSFATRAQACTAIFD